MQTKAISKQAAKLARKSISQKLGRRVCQDKCRCN